jgi:hypothetical protein
MEREVIVEQAYPAALPAANGGAKNVKTAARRGDVKETSVSVDS